MAPILEIRNLSKTFGETRILRDIHVAVDPGNFLVLVGPSGCGKSTLLNCIAGLEAPSGGHIRIGGRDMAGVNPKDRDIAMVFQSYALYPTMSVARNITFGMRVRGIDRAVQERKLAEVAEQLQIGHLLDRRPAQLSGGQRQRVAMGRALVRDPMLFLFDEPLSNLDAKLRVEMRTEIKRLHQQLGRTMVYVTHDQIEAMTLATHIMVMKDGAIQQLGTPAEIYRAPANIFVADFMGAPVMNLIPARLRRSGGEARLEIDRPGGTPIVFESTPLPGPLPDEVILGLRPEDITEAGRGGDGPSETVECRIDMVEPAGADTYVVSSLGGRPVTARLPPDTAAAPGTVLPLAFDLSRMSLFRPQTGERLN